MLTTQHNQRSGCHYRWQPAAWTFQLSFHAVGRSSSSHSRSVSICCVCWTIYRISYAGRRWPSSTSASSALQIRYALCVSTRHWPPGFKCTNWVGIRHICPLALPMIATITLSIVSAMRSSIQHTDFTIRALFVIYLLNTAILFAKNTCIPWSSKTLI